MSAPISGESAPDGVVASTANMDEAAAMAPAIVAHENAVKPISLRQHFSEWMADARGKLPGLWVAVVVSLAATFIAQQSGGSPMLYALLFGMAFRFLYIEPSCDAGIDFASRVLLRFAVALLGAHITFSQIAQLGWWPIAVVGLATPLTILFGVVSARLFRRGAAEGVLFGGSVGICGTTAAMAIASVLPRTQENQRATLLAVVGVTALSTLAMIFYPMLAAGLNLDWRQTGILMGASIHNIPQAVAAGYVVSPQAGDIATYVKLVRITLLAPMIVLCSLVFRSSVRESNQSGKSHVLPLFLYGFAALLIVNSVGAIPEKVGNVLNDISRWCMVVAIAAVGLKTSYRELVGLGWRPVLMLFINTVFIVAAVLVLLWLEKFF